MRSRSTLRLGALVALGLATVLTAAACAPDAPAPTTTTPTTTPAPTVVAVAAATPTAPGYYGLPVAFSSAGSTASTGQTIASYLWTFGDGTTSTAANPTKTYTTPGPFSVSLKVTDTAAVNKTVTISVAQPAPAGAVAIVPTANPISVPTLNGSSNVRVYWNGQAPNKLIFINVCKKSTIDPTFDYSQDCGPYTEVLGTATASGSGYYDFVNIKRGPEDSGDLKWGLFAAGDTAPAGYTKFTTGYIRVTSDSIFNTDFDQELAFTITG